MAGYLGKISAIVSANTADFASKLNGSAKEVRKFASTIESTIGSASRQAATSLANIYTPLQKLERALQAASTMKLSFSGFAGAIKDIDVLKQRMTSLNQRQIDIILKTSGLKSVNEFKDAVQGLNAKQFSVLLRVGGVEKLKEIRESIAAGRGEFEVVAQTREAEARVKELTQQVNEARKAGAVVITVDDDAVAAARNELRNFTIEQSKALGQQRVKPREFRGDLTSGIAAEEAALAGARARQMERDRLLEAATTDRQRKNINKNYAGVDADVEKRVASLEKLKASLAELERLEQKLKAARAGTSSDSDLKKYEAELDAATAKHRELLAESQKKITAVVGVNVSDTELEKILSGAIERGEILERVFMEAGLEGSAAFERVVAVLKELGVSDMEATVAKMRQMASVTEEITKPLGEVSKTLAGLGVDVQSGFQPALKSSQAAAERLVGAIKAGEQPAAALEALFAEVRREVVASEQAVSRLAGASQMLGNLKTGRELSFTSPELTASLARGAQIGNSAAALPASAISANPQIAERLIEIKRLSDQAVAALAKLESARADGFSMAIDAQNAELKRLLSLLNDVQDRAGEEIKVLINTAEAEAKAKALDASLLKMRENVEFTVTGRVQNFDQARQEMSRLQGQVGGLEGGRSAFNARLQSLGALVEEGDVGKLDQVRDLISQIDTSLSERKELDLNDSKAKAKLDQFAESIESLKQRADFVITGRPQNLDQVRSELEGILGDIKKVEAADRGGLQVRVDAVIEALGRQDLDAANEELERLRAAAAAVIPVRVDASGAVDRISQINETWDMAIRQIPTDAQQIDAEFSSLATRIGRFDLTDRLSLDPLIRDFRDSAAAGDPLIAQLEHILALTEAVDQIEARVAANPPVPFGPDLPAGFGGRADAGLGPAINDPRRGLESLRGGITSIKSQLDQLPESVRSRFVPAIQEAEDEFRRLSASGAALPQQIDAASRRLAALSIDARRADAAMKFGNSFGGAGVSGISLGLDERSLAGYTAQLQILQGYMSRIPATAAGPAIASFNQLRNAIQQAFDDRTINTEEVRRELAALMQATSQTVAALAGVRASRVGRDLQRAGDVGRMGIDKWSLALNQGAFAIDDFLSSTGGLEFKLRAISNNITQMAFILGGTTGLFIGLGAVIAGQATVALIKWMNNGRTAEDRTKALNEALARQVSLVGELAEAFRSLSSAVSRGLFSDQAEKAREFATGVSDILKKQQELSRQRASQNDPIVQRERAEQQKLKREIEKEEDPTVRLGKARLLRESEDRERRRIDLVSVQPPPSAGEIRRETRLRAPRGFRDDAEGIPEGTDRQSMMTQADAIRPAVDRLKQIVAEGDSSFDFGRFEIAAKQLEVLGGLLDRLDRAVEDSLTQLAAEIVDASRGPAEQIRQAQEEVAKAIEAGVPGARLFQSKLDENAKKLEEAYKTLERAIEGKDEAGNTLSPSQKEERTAAAREAVNDLQAQRAEMAARTDALRYERIVDPQKQFAAIMDRSRGNLRDAGLENGSVARRLREIEAEREQLQARSQLPEFQTPEMVRAINDSEEALKEEAAAIEATTLALKLFGDALNRAADEAKGNLSSAQQRADEARRNDLALGTPESALKRQRAEADLAEQRQAEAKARRELDNERAKQEEIKRGPEFARMAEIDQQLQGGSLSAKEQEELRAERARLERTVQPQLDASERRAQQIVADSTRREERQKRALRGEELIRTPDQKFAEETQTGLGDIRERFSRYDPFNLAGLRAEEGRFMRQRAEDARTQTEAGRGAEAARTDREKFELDISKPGGLVDSITARRRKLEGQGVGLGGQRQFLQSAIREQMDEVAPMIAGFRDERETARLQGPSRARMTVSDITTSQGMSELNRMLRGDDPAKDANLAELRKQSGLLDTLVREVKNNNPGLIP